MKIEDIEIGKWYKVYEIGGEYGIIGKVVDKVVDMVGIKCYWAGFIRSRLYIEPSSIIGESVNPGLFRNRLRG